MTNSISKTAIATTYNRRNILLRGFLTPEFQEEKVNEAHGNRHPHFQTFQSYPDGIHG